MTLRRNQANAIVFVAGIAVLGLAACMQDNRQTAMIPSSTAPSTYGLFYMDEGGSAKLAYGAANSDDVGLMMECAKGSRVISVSDVARGAVGRPTLVLASGGQKDILNAAPSDGDGAALLVANTRSDTPPLRAFRRSGKIDVGYPGAEYDITANAAEKQGVQRFFAACDGTA